MKQTTGFLLTGRTSPWVALLLAALLASCGEQGPSGPPDTPAAPVGLVVSDPVAGAGGALPESAAGMIYVSADPGTFPDGVSATVANSATGASATAEIVEGGFDPVAVAGSAGDELEVTVFYSDGSSESYGATASERKRPRVVRTRPQKDAVDVPLNSIMVVVFSEPVDPSTVTLESISLGLDGAQVAATLALDADGLLAELDPDELLEPGTTYTLAVSTDVLDLTGDALEESVTVSFTTDPVQDDGTRAIAIVSGQAQEGKAGRALDEPLVVRVTDGYGNGVPNYRVAWTGDEGALDGRFDENGDPVRAIYTRTDADGLTSVSFVPTVFDRIGVTACTFDCDGARAHPSVTFTTDTRDPEARVTIVSGNEQMAKAGRPADPLVIRLTDGQGEPVPHVELRWSITYGYGALLDGIDDWGNPVQDGFDEWGHAITAARVRTNAGGEAQVHVIPTWFGLVYVQAVVERVSGPLVPFGLDATDAGAALTIVSGDQQEGKVGEPLPAPFSVRVTDGQGSPVANVRVDWTAVTGGRLRRVEPLVGAGDALYTRSDGDGLARVSFWPQLGTDRVIAEPAGTYAPVSFTTETNTLVIGYRTWEDHDGNPRRGIFDYYPDGCEAWGGLTLPPPGWEPTCPEDWDVSYVSVPVGTTVEWVNHTSAWSLQLASTTTPPGGASFASGMLAENERFQFVLGVAGTWEYAEQGRTAGESSFWDGIARGKLTAY